MFKLAQVQESTRKESRKTVSSRGVKRRTDLQLRAVSERRTLAMADRTEPPAKRPRPNFSASPDLESLRAQQAAFAKARDWDQFHTPRNLALALVGEVHCACVALCVACRRMTCVWAWLYAGTSPFC